MKRQAEERATPFFVYLPYTATHYPDACRTRISSGRSGKGPWGDLLMQIDSYVGQSCSRHI